MRELKVLTLASVFVILSIATPASAEPFDPEPYQEKVTAAQVVRLGGGSYLGVSLREIDADRVRELKLKEEAGVEITRVEDDSPAAKAGIKAGDAVLAYNGQRVEGMEQFSRFVRETPAGREVKLLISRDGNTQTIAAKLGARKSPLLFSSGAPRVEVPLVAPMPNMPDLPRGLMMWRSSTLGIEGESLRGQMAEFFGVKEGVLVRSVSKDSPAEKAGLRAGDVILRIDETKVSSPNEIGSAIRALKDKKTFPVTVVREKREMTVNATIESQRSEWELAAPRAIHYVRPSKL
jgi:serine protease Do